MRDRVIVGVDPGGRDTGIVIRHDERLLWSDTVHRDQGEAVDTYARRVRRAVDAAVERAGLISTAPRAVAVEDVVEPSPHVRLTNVRGLLDTAVVLGAVLTHDLAPVVLVLPYHHGGGPLIAYPEALRPTRGRGLGKDALRHVRSGWDIAGAGAAQIRQALLARHAGRPA
jgi:hypothetical protein